MKPQPVYLLLLLFLISCKNTINKKAAPVQDTENNSPIVDKEKIAPLQDVKKGFSVIDSLSKYTHKDSLLIIDNTNDKYSTLFIGKAEKRSYAVWMETDSLMVFYQKPDGKKWTVTNSFNYGMPFGNAKNEDLNGDGFDDVKVSSFNGAAGNTENRIFIYNPVSETFKLNEFYSLPNVKYNRKDKFIQSSWFSGAAHCQEKYKYIITGDSLAFDMGVTFCPNDEDEGKTGTLEFYKMVNKKRVTIKKETGLSNTLWGKFDHTFWNSEHDAGGW